MEVVDPGACIGGKTIVVVVRRLISRDDVARNSSLFDVEADPAVTVVRQQVVFPKCSPSRLL